MAVSWTEKQKQVIELRDRNLLVSAAAGSGKTAVLVERIIEKVLDETNPIDIDRLLVVTFTKAAAAEMRERVAEAIEKRMDAQPRNAYLQRQSTLVHHAMITTIDSFCLYVVRNYFHCIHLEPGFRVADPTELSLLMEDVLDQVLEQWYDRGEKDFITFADNYANAKNDTPIREMVLQLYNFSQSYPWPDEWLLSLPACYLPQNLTEEKLMTENGWLRQLLDYIRFLIKGNLDRLLTARAYCMEADGPQMYLENIEYVIGQVQQISELQTFDEIGQALTALDFGRLKAARNYSGDPQIKDMVSSLRDSVKKHLESLRKQYFSLPLQRQTEDLAKLSQAVSVLSRITLDVSSAFAKKKEEKNILDFSDVEHMALRILIDPDTKEPTSVARDFQAKFEEVMIDEYQDSNYVQEAILSAVSHGNGRDNRFMVGDVKQSIYRFRLARPELFMEKYDTYTTEESQNQLICLDQNFRSRPEVLDSVNAIFERIMKRDMGGVAYDEEAKLHVGATYPDAAQSCRTTMLLACSDEETMEAAEVQNAKELEARLIALKIRELKQTMQVTEKDGTTRSLRYSDIVILLRSPGSYGEEFVKQLAKGGVPAFKVSQSGYFGALEVQTVLSFLQVIDNPLQDIPLADTLLSPVWGFTNEQLAILRTSNEVEGGFLYEDLCAYEKREENDSLTEKVEAFLLWLNDFRKRKRELAVHDLIDQLLRETGYLAYVSAWPDGEKRKANLEMLLAQATTYESTSYRGLFHFIRYIDQLKRYEVDFGESDTLGENADVVRIMSIHKSKGLEFPVVFAAGMHHKINQKDSQNAVIFDVNYGVGLPFVEGDKHRKRTTLFKQMMAANIRRENMGEELRVLYVALTRAKELLIMTGIVKEQAVLAGYELEAEREASFLDRIQAGCYLDLVMPGIYKHPHLFSVEQYEPKDFRLEDEIETAEEVLTRRKLWDRLEDVSPDRLDEIARRFCETYPYEHETSMKTKVSVSEIKHRNMIFEAGEEETLAWYAKEETETYIPDVARTQEHQNEPEVNRGALRGTAVHRVMECLDYSHFSDASDTRSFVSGQLDAIRKSGRMRDTELALVDEAKLIAFFDTDLVAEIAAADHDGRLHREQPFVMGIPANEADPANQSEELVLVQGIIDLYFEDEQGIVLLDYKTDAVKSEQQLVDRYETQMRLYARALEAATGKKVYRKLLYSFRLNSVISIEE